MYNPQFQILKHIHSNIIFMRCIIWAVSDLSQCCRSFVASSLGHQTYSLIFCFCFLFLFYCLAAVLATKPFHCICCQLFGHQTFSLSVNSSSGKGAQKIQTIFVQDFQMREHLQHLPCFLVDVGRSLTHTLRFPLCRCLWTLTERPNTMRLFSFHLTKLLY